MQSSLKRKREDGDDGVAAGSGDANNQQQTQATSDAMVDPMAWVDKLSVKELQMELKERNISLANVVEKEELVRRLRDRLHLDAKEGVPIRRKYIPPRKDCPYLDTIKRELLDFDFEKLCSVTMLNLNVYACLVCGKYFQGRGRNSQAFTHSVQSNHHVFINLETEQVYSLPEDYEVDDPSLNDIKSNLNPKFSSTQISELDTVVRKSEDLEGNEYLPGFIGLNNLGQTDFINVSVHALCHVPPLRNFFLQPSNYATITDRLVNDFGELTRKIFSPSNFRAHVDPHELVQSISLNSNRKFKAGTQSDPLEFMQFLLNALHAGLGGTKVRSTIVTQVFQGELEIWTNKPAVKDFVPVTQTIPFYTLALDLPPTPLFVDEEEKNILPQIPIFTILQKYNGKQVTSFPTGEDKKYHLTKLPEFLIVQIRRFTKNNWFKEKNPTIVNFPLKNLDLRDYLKNPASETRTKYDLIANICHDGLPESGTYRVHVFHKASKSWYELQDLMVKEILPQLIAVSESYVQIYERQK